MKKLETGNIVGHIYLITLTLIFVFPSVWVIIFSLKGKGELIGDPTTFWSKTWTFDYYARVISDLRFFVNTKDGVIISLVTTLTTITVVALVAYGIVRFFMQLGSVISKVLAVAYIFPPIPLVIPYSVIMGKPEFINIGIGLVIVYLPSSMPYAVWLLTGFFRTVSLEIKEAARIDGANKIQAFVRVVLLLVAPGVVATAIYTFTNTWNELLYALILMSNASKMTVAAAPRPLDGAETLNWGDIMATSALVVLPSAVFFCLIQNKTAGGMPDGAAKS